MSLTFTPRRLFIRTDGNPHIGLGHLSRCLALAKSLHPRFEITFFLKQTPADIIQSLIPPDSGFLHASIDPQIAEKDEINTIGKWLKKGDIFLIDNYTIDQEYVEGIRNLGVITVSINDIPENCLATDYIINHTPGLQGDIIRTCTGSKWLLGEKYLLLREAFIQCIPAYPPSSRNDIFICFGGSDPSNLTLKVLQFIERMGLNEAAVHVLTGQASRNHETLSAFVNTTTLGQVQLYANLDAHGIISLLKKSRVAIVPASVISLECMCVGIGIITGFYADNQRLLNEQYAKLQLATSVGYLPDMRYEDFLVAWNNTNPAIQSSLQKSAFQKRLDQDFEEVFSQFKPS